MESANSPFPLFESIRLLDGNFQHLQLHEARMKRSGSVLFSKQASYMLETWLQQWPFPTQGLFKCRLNYGVRMDRPVYIPYQRKPIQSLRLLHDEDISYALKFNNRRQIDQLFVQRETCDDVLIAKNGMITDSSYCNIVFRKGNKWITPNTPLLKGVQREWLLQHAIIREAPVTVEMLQNFDAFKLINAMIPWEDALELPVSAIKTD
jgi:4-amino-4-deoxychorismate lyase